MRRILAITGTAAVLTVLAASPASAGPTCKGVLPDGTLITATPYVSSSHSLLGYAVGDHKVRVGPYAEANEWFPTPMVQITAKDKNGFTYVVAKSPTGHVASGATSGWTMDSWLQQDKKFLTCMEKRFS